jgi:hypothetical protein
MRGWACRHRTAILVAYSVVVLTLILILQLLESTGAIR